MKRKKLIKFAEIKEMPNVFDGEKLLEKSWGKDIFKNSNPIILELACGSGKFSIQMAQNNPNINYIAMDRKGERIWLGAKEAETLNLPNLKFFQGNIKYIEKEFQHDKVDHIWITFPDPFPKLRNSRQRLTHINYLNKYLKFLKQNGTINLKTDFKALLEFSETQFIELNGIIKNKIIDIYSKNNLPEHLLYQTYFEKLHLAQNKQIHYIQAEFKQQRLN